MKKIEELAKKNVSCYSGTYYGFSHDDLISAYESGYMKAKEWISVEDKEKPDIGAQIIMRYPVNDLKVYFYETTQYFDEGVFGTMITHWKYVD